MSDLLANLLVSTIGGFVLLLTPVYDKPSSSSEPISSTPTQVQSKETNVSQSNQSKALQANQVTNNSSIITEGDTNKTYPPIQNIPSDKTSDN